MLFVIFQELVEKLSKRELSKDDYPCVNDPSPTFHSTTLPIVCEAPAAHSMRSRPKSTWARQRYSDDGYSRCMFSLDRFLDLINPSPYDF